MNNIITIIKKEFARFFKDKRMVFTTILLPGLMIFVMYSFMGDALSNMDRLDEGYEPIIYIYDTPDSLNTYFDEFDWTVTSIEGHTQESIKQDIEDKECDLLIIFPENFDEQVETYDVSNETLAAPNIEIFYNSTKTEAQHYYTQVSSLLTIYEDSLSNKFNINSSDTVYDLASEEDVAGMIFSMMLPMLMMIFLFSGCMALAPESIAGEKERGTIATLLVTPINRSHLAIGKIISLCVLSLLSGISSFIGVLLSLPKLMGGEMSGMSNNYYTISDYAMLLIVILSTVLIIISLISIISAYAKNVKEATTLIMPFMIISMLVGITSMFGDGAPDNPMLYFIPLYNSVQAMNGIFSFDYKLINIILTLVSNVFYSGLLIVVLTRLFNSEKVMFSK